MTWNYRVIRHKDEDRQEEWLAIYEVFYDDNSNPNACTENSIDIAGGDIGALKY